MDFEAKKKEIDEGMIPAASKEHYLKEFKRFKDFLFENQLPLDEIASPTTLLVYFEFLKKEMSYSPSTMKYIYSILNCYHMINWSLNLRAHCPQLKHYLSRAEKETEKEKKKANTFEREEVER